MKRKQSVVLGTVPVDNKEQLMHMRQKMTPEQIRAIRKATGGNRTTHIFMRAASTLGS